METFTNTKLTKMSFFDTIIFKCFAAVFIVLNSQSIYCIWFLNRVKILNNSRYVVGIMRCHDRKKMTLITRQQKCYEVGSRWR